MTHSIGSSATIIIAARNASNTIARAIRSACEQGNCPVLLIDDASSDDTIARAKDAGGSRLRVVQRSRHAALGQTRQYGLEAIETPFGIWLDSDDEFLPGRVDRLVHRLLKDGGEIACDTVELIDGIDSRFIRILAIPAFLRKRNPLARLFERNYLQGVGFIAFKTEFARSIGYDTLLHGAEDMDFVLRSVAAGARICLVDEPGYRMYAYPSSLSRQRKQQLIMYRQCLLKHEYEFVRHLFQKAGYDERVTIWGLTSMALFRWEYEIAGQFVERAESWVGDPEEILEPDGPCPMPESWRVAFCRGTIALLVGSASEAVRWLARAEQIVRTPEGANNLGVAQSMMGCKKEAEALFDASLCLFPEYFDARANLNSANPSHVTSHPLRREPSRMDY